MQQKHKTIFEAGKIRVELIVDLFEFLNSSQPGTFTWLPV